MIFPALINDPSKDVKELAKLSNILDPSNFEIKRMIRIVESGMFLVPYSASLVSFSSFYSHFLETLSKMDTFLK